MKRALRGMAWLVGIGVGIYLLYWIVVYGLAIAHRYQPAEATLAIEGKCNPSKWPEKLSVMTWNLGYGGMAAENDFFLDGGHNILANDKTSVVRHLTSMAAVLRKHPVDLYLLEEVDSGSWRSYSIDERQVVMEGVDACCSSYALNHDVFFLPYPMLRPLGPVRSGMLALGRFRPAEAKRIQLHGSFPWPDRAFQMERCLLLWKLPREDGKNWTIIQLHLEAWDAGSIRAAELAQLRELALKEYSAGNFVLLGGDWNAVLPGVRMDEFTQRKPNAHLLKLNEDFLPSGWTWGIDRSRPSNRSTNVPYDPQKNYLTVIDGFVVSPNVRIESVETIALNFQDTDHEPVHIELSGQ
jgi:endonuclease/exonuclease/phosphatase family metal-dependent hydrolase